MKLDEHVAAALDKLGRRERDDVRGYIDKLKLEVAHLKREDIPLRKDGEDEDKDLLSLMNLPTDESPSNITAAIEELKGSDQELVHNRIESLKSGTAALKWELEKLTAADDKSPA